jgi:hypothetical protein
LLGTGPTLRRLSRPRMRRQLRGEGKAVPEALGVSRPRSVSRVWAETPAIPVRCDRVDETGKVSLRSHSRLYKIALGRAHQGRSVKLLIADQEIRVIEANGELIRELTLDPSRNYKPLQRA